MTDNDIKTICEKIGSLQEKILKSKFAETVTESEMLCLILAVRGLNDQKAEIAVLTTAVDNSTKEFLKLHDEYQDQNAEIEKLQEVNADLNESLRLAAEANKDLKAEIERLREYYKLYFDGEREIKELQENIEHLQGKIGLYEAEVERLKKYNTDVAFKHYNGGIKEFAERLHKGIDDFRDKREMVMLPYTESALLIIERKIDNLVAEMTEGT